jgi:mediator of RNA polymerase II transcription subunit 12, fungi type
LPLFESSAQDFNFRRKVDTLLTWSVTPLQFGEHRPFAAVTLLRVWRMKANHAAAGDDFGSLDDLLQDHIFDWLDSSDVESESINVPRIAVLLEKLVEHHLFSYAKYIQRLIARGEPGLLFAEVSLGAKSVFYFRSQVERSLALVTATFSGVSQYPSQ